jgi:hypothetical protein
MLGVLKVIFDRVDGLQPLGYLIGEQEKPGTIKGKRRKKQD